MHMPDRKAPRHESVSDVLASRDWLRVTLESIGDGVITTDKEGNVSFLNNVAQALTGWTLEDAVGRPLLEVFNIVNQDTRATVENPALRALHEGVIVGLANHTVLIARDQSERNIDDSAAPIRNAAGEVAGAVLIFRDITERYQQERYVRDQLEYVRNILETQRQPFLVLDRDLRIVSANRAFYQAFRQTPEATVGHRLVELAGGALDIPRLRELLEAVLPQDASFEDFELDREFPPIGRRILLLNARRVIKPGNNSNLILLSIEDVTQRRDALRRLEESEEAYRTLVTQVKDHAIFRTDTDGRAVTWNEGVKRVLGFDKDEFIGADITEAIFTPEDIRAGVPELELQNAAETGVAGNDRWMQRKNGQRFYASGATTALRDENGHLIGFTKVLRDQTETRLAQDDAAHLAAIVSSSQDAIVSKSLTGIVNTWNKAAEHLFGYTAEEMIGQSITLLVPEEHLDEEDYILGCIREGRLIEHYETVRRRKDGRLINVSLTVSPVRDHAGNIIGASKIARDISDRIALEKKILQQTEALAAESRRKDEFLAMLSHELRNPLAPIRSAVHLLKLHQKDENPIQRQAREIIERQVGNLTQLLSDLLEVSRVISGRIRLNLQAVDVNQLVQHAVETVRPLIDQRRHTLTLNLCDQNLWTRADATRMEEVFINLLNNAAKYTDEGGHIQVYCETLPGDDTVQIRIRDNGVGIDRKLLPYVFDLFTQAERSMDRAAGGLGIGLSLVHRLVDLHGGSVSAESPPPDATVGSEFTVRLPLIEAPSPAPQPHPEPDTAAPPPEGLRVLVVDDNIDMVMMLASALRAKGYIVEVAYTGDEGLQIAHRWRPDIILLDIGLPGLDGYEIARRLRAGRGVNHDQASTYTGRIIALTGYGRETDIERALQAGFDAHVTKPYDLDKLEKTMLQAT